MNVILTLIGWLTLVLITCFCTLGYIIFAFNGIGKYNIGGVPNHWSKKIKIVLFGIGFYFIWDFIFFIAPFKVSL